MKKITLLLSLISGLVYGASTFTITTTSIPSALCQHPYTTTLKTVNAFGNVTWSKTSGSFPSGVQIGALNGTISGLAGINTNTTYTFVITATDQAGSQAVRTYSLIVTNYQIPNTDYVKYSTNILNSQANWWDYYDVVNNLYDKPTFVAGSGVTISKPSTWEGSAPTYTLSSSVTANTTITGSGVATVTGTNPFNIGVLREYGLTTDKIGDGVTTRWSAVGAGGFSTTIYTQTIPANTLTLSKSKLKNVTWITVTTATGGTTANVGAILSGTTISPTGGAMTTAGDIIRIESTITYLTSSTGICEVVFYSTRTGVYTLTQTNLTSDFTTALSLSFPLSGTNGAGSTQIDMTHSITDNFYNQ